MSILSSSGPAVRAEGLAKRFGATEALRGIDLEVEPGTICGLLGPNGAGKTTAVRILTTLLKPDRGHAVVAGFDVMKEPGEVRANIGLAGQYAAVDELLTGRANLEMVGRLYHMPGKQARLRADELLEQFELTDAANRIAKTYSGGMRRRLDLAASLVAAPPVLFLDEPTTGLDPRSRVGMWQQIRKLVGQGTTLLLTTQYLDEADQLADHIAVIDTGQVIAQGTADQLKAASGGGRIEVVIKDDRRLFEATVVVQTIARCEPDVDRRARRISAAVDDGSSAIAALVRMLDGDRIAVEEIALRRPTLDEVFLRLTGHGASDEGGSAEDWEEVA